EVVETGAPAAQALEVVVEAADLCPRFCARVLDVRMAPSPAWMRERLEKVGVRPISTVVDLTNYVMMEMGHPSHAFDLARIPDGRLHVRWAREGERLTTLDGVERVLGPRQGVVAGPQAALALAGIMGGASSEVGDDTRVVALEAAYWDPLSIRRAARSLGMHTEASHRFERGADPEAPPLATARIAHLLARMGAGSVRPGLVDRHVAPRPARTAVFRPGRTSALLGVPVAPQQAQDILQGLGFTVRESVEGVSAEVPSWRGDVAREVDLVEEVGRHYGLDKIPSTLPPGRGAEGLRPWQARLRAVREALAGAGLTEVVTYAFVSDRAAAAHVPPRVALRNPLSDEQGVLRTSLIVPGLLSVLQTNLRRGRRDAQVFEVGRVFLPAPAGADWPVDEVQRLGVLMTGSGRPHWSGRGRAADFFDATGALHVLGQRLGLPLWELRAGESLPAFLHPGKAAEVWSGGQRVGYVGAVHPGQAEAWELREETIVAELDLEPLLAARPAPRFRALPRFPMMARDLSIAAPAAMTAGRIESLIREAAGDLLREVWVVDRYEGPPLKPGTVSVTVTLQYQHPSRTLTGDEVQASVRRVVEALHAQGCEIRGE
ncbi:MAG TPA: phenylalanine--tRNA ligase subunit beta, partial [Vicinamibacteria bacterium]|nr:phenylalanine--tRNA ligase subunit beta [Vicinamibacteria bacterium]